MANPQSCSSGRPAGAGYIRNSSPHPPHTHVHAQALCVLLYSQPPSTTSSLPVLPSFLSPPKGAESSERCNGGRPAGARYTRDSVRCLLQLLGCKPRLAYKISALVFSTIEAAVAPPAGGTGARAQRTSRRPFAVHAHGGYGRIAVSLPRGDFMPAVAAQYMCKVGPTSYELQVATGWVAGAVGGACIEEGAGGAGGL